MQAVICLGIPARRLPSAGGAVWLREPWNVPAADVVVRWGAAGGPPARIREYNRSEALARWTTREARLDALSAAGVPVYERLPRRFYRVAVWDLVPCGVRRVRHARRRRARRPAVKKPPPRARLRRMLQMAVRAVHALRLDFAAVDLVLVSGGQAQVVDVDPAPPPDSPEGRCLLQALAASLARPEEPEDLLTLGADPELVFYHPRRKTLVPASRFLPREGSVGLDNARVPGSRRLRPVAELRPEPSLDPDRLLWRLRRLLRRLRRQVGGRLWWIAGSGVSPRFPIGGHIHFGGLRPHAALLRALDAYLAVPVLLLEDPERARLRRRKYGWIGDFRLQEWGFEYRTLPSWLVSPRYARAILHLAWLVARHWRSLTRDPFLDPELHRAFRECHKDPFYALFPALWSDLQALPDFPAQARALVPLQRAIAERRTWPEGRDIRRAWGIA